MHLRDVVGRGGGGGLRRGRGGGGGHGSERDEGGASRDLNVKSHEGDAHVPPCYGVSSMNFRSFGASMRG